MTTFRNENEMKRKSYPKMQSREKAFNKKKNRYSLVFEIVKEINTFFFCRRKQKSNKLRLSDQMKIVENIPKNNIYFDTI